MPNSGLRMLPAALIGLRFILGPFLFICTVRELGPGAILATLLLAMLSDIFDGVIARRLGIATAGLRVMDSRADAWFFVWVGASCWSADRSIVLSCWLPISLEIAQQVFSYAYDLIRYRRITSLHTYATKLWAFALYLAVAGILAFHTGVLVWVTWVIGLISFIDAFAIKLILPGWQHDILSNFHARRMLLDDRSARAPQVRRADREALSEGPAEVGQAVEAD